MTIPSILVSSYAENPADPPLDNVYCALAVETIANPHEPSRAGIRVRPLPGQGVRTNLRVECSNTMRDMFPVGTVFILRAKLTSRQSLGVFIYSWFGWGYDVVSREEADALIRARKIGFFPGCEYDRHYMHERPLSAVRHSEKELLQR